MDRHSIKLQIENILSKLDFTRNSDTDLLAEIWKEYYSDFIHSDDNGEFIYLKDLHEVPHQDTIKRIRAMIQNKEKKYLPTDFTIFLNRVNLSRIWKEFLGYRAEMGKDNLVTKLSIYFEAKRKGNW